jgi:archaellum component FlaC
MRAGFEEMEKSVKELQDNQIVQSYRLGRTESNLDRLEADLHRLEGVVEKIADGFILLQSAMKGLMETVDRFLRRHSHNGYHPPDEGPEGVHSGADGHPRSH